MDIQQVFDAYTAKVADVQDYRSLTQKAANRELEHLLKQQEILATWPEKFPINSHSHNFRDAESRRPIFYGARDLTVEDSIDALARHTNRQHQWFLAEVYELFEEFLKRAYACMGFHNPALWSLRDFGAIRWDQVSSKDYSWFLGQTRIKKDTPHSILRQFREVLPRLRHTERHNKLDVDLLVAATLVGNMRHQIVHARGIIPDKRQFAEGVLKKIGYSVSGGEEHLQFIDERLLVDSSDGSIYLLRVRAPDSRPPFRIHFDIFDGVADYLMAYAQEIAISLRGTLAADSGSTRQGPPD